MEFGVHRGVSINLLADLMPEYRINGFDSFEGFKSVEKGSHWDSFQKKFEIHDAPQVRKNVVLHKGFVEETFHPYIASRSEPGACLVHLDLDIYEPTKIVLDWVVKRGGKTFVMFDELIGYREFHLHEYRAFLETIVENKIPYKVLSLFDEGQDRPHPYGRVFMVVGA